MPFYRDFFLFRIGGPLCCSLYGMGKWPAERGFWALFKWFSALHIEVPLCEVRVG